MTYSLKEVDVRSIKSRVSSRMSSKGNMKETVAM